jgi:glucose 1-dehydrogenase
VVHLEATERLALGAQSIGVAADVSKVADLQKLVDAAASRFGRLDIMVDNAGIETRTLLDSSEAQYDKVMAVNLKAACACSRAPPASSSRATTSWCSA